MRYRHFYFLAVLACILLSFSSISKAESVRKTVSLNKDWKFQLGDFENGQIVNLNCNTWRTLDVPHDWSIEGDYNQYSIVKRGGGYLPAGIAWYRKTLSLNKSYAGRRIIIEFEGVMSHSDVWVNEHHVGYRPIGYLPLYYDITDYVHLDGRENVIAVRVNNDVQPASRWYAGAGIDRHVRLYAIHPIHLTHWGVFITTPEVSTDKATVQIQSSVTNESDQSQQLTLQTTITSPTGKSFTTDAKSITVAPGDTVTEIQQIAVASPEIWDISSPLLYTAETTVKCDGKTLDSEDNTFGIREFHFESETGFWLNGRNLKILGACVHHDGGAVGTAVPASVWERRIKLLKEVGCNAIRGAHCPMDPAFYELCDRMGMLVFDETFDTWTAAKPNGEKAYNLHFNEWWKIDATAQIMRVRNHPCIFLYSLGNEIRDNLNSETGRQTFLDMRDLTRQLDPTRPITMALFQAAFRGLYTNGFSELLDVIGQNYGEQGLVSAWAGKAGRKIIGTENTPSRSAWLVLRDNPQMAGEFLWTGFEYLGESDWPKVSWNTALFNRNGGWKHTGWERKSWWTTEPMVHVVRKDDAPNGSMTEDYTPYDPQIGTVSLTVYSNCEEVELYLNGVSLGKQEVPADDAPNVFTVDYKPGTIKAIGRKGGKDVATHQLITATEPVKLNLTTERTSIPYDWEEVVYVTATIEDKDGIRYPNSNHVIQYTVSGPGEIVSMDNSDVYSHERYKTNRRTAYKGQVIGIIRATAASGTITVTASAEGLPSSSVKINIEK